MSEETAQNAGQPAEEDPQTLLAPLQSTIRITASLATKAASTIAEAYTDGLLTPREALRALHRWYTPITAALKALDHARDVLRSAMEAPIQRLGEPAELWGEGIVTWVEASPTTSYPAREVAAISSTLTSGTQDAAAALSQLALLEPQLVRLVVFEQLSEDEAARYRDALSDLARIARTAQEAAKQLVAIRKDGTKAGYVKVDPPPKEQRPRPVPAPEAPF
jgi:hypothetical protein